MTTSPRLFASLTILFCLTLLILTGAAPAQADSIIFRPIDAVYMVRDPGTKDGYKEKLRWQVNSPDDWARFYENLPNLPKDNTTNADPLNGKVDDMVVFTHTDDNDLTGYDIYVSNLGIMKVTRGATHQIYPDTNQLRAYLIEEQKDRASFESLSGDSVSSKSNGIIVTYNINESIPNPVWRISEQNDIRIYDSFFKALKPLTGAKLKSARSGENFEGFGTFVMNLNYPRAPARIATVGKTSIRMSNGFISTDFYQDTQNFYKFFKDQAREMIKYKEKFKSEEEQAEDKRKF